MQAMRMQMQSLLEAIADLSPDARAELADALRDELSYDTGPLGAVSCGQEELARTRELLAEERARNVDLEAQLAQRPTAAGAGARAGPRARRRGSRSGSRASA